MVSVTRIGLRQTNPIWQAADPVRDRALYFYQASEIGLACPRQTHPVERKRVERALWARLPTVSNVQTIARPPELSAHERERVTG